MYLFCLAQARSSEEKTLQCIEFFIGFLSKAAYKHCAAFYCIFCTSPVYRIYLCVSSNILLWHLLKLLYYSRNIAQNIQIRNLNKIPPPRKQKKGQGPQSFALLPRNARAGCFFDRTRTHALSSIYRLLYEWREIRDRLNQSSRYKHETGSFLFVERKLIFSTTGRQDNFYACTLELIATGTLKSMHACIQTLYIVQISYVNIANIPVQMAKGL